MADRRDPVERAATGRDDLYDIATWEPRSEIDRFSIRLYGWLIGAARTTVILVATVIVIAQFALTGLAAIANPLVGIFILLSILPALAIVLYVWRADVTQREPLSKLVVTFLLAFLFAGFAGILNTLAQPLFGLVPFIGMALFFFLIVAPVEETVKWLAIRLYAYRSEDFRAVIDGAVYGAAAGFGFATIENSLFIGRQYLSAVQTGAPLAPVGAAFQTAAIRTFAGPGHVIYSAFAGYYLGLAKFNRAHAGPIVVKGLLIAAVLHATYNTLVGIVPSILSTVAQIPVALAFILFVVVYDGVLGYWLYRKIHRYRRMYHSSGAGRPARPSQGGETSHERSPAEAFKFQGPADPSRDETDEDGQND